ncbi:MAG: acetolactate synthase small subunit [Kiritimatiellae bacterium]|nr:acetolactate synthase small subunit [Kiritimatiellia bacterium]MDW8457605.1 acetolactate synthase small subunit [Verrucomicrobiota bacterium]
MTTQVVNPHIAQSTGLHTISVYVANKPGVLARIAQVFARRGYNIESLVVSPAMDGNFSRMTIGLSGSPEGMEQIIKQTSKLIDVLRCTDHTDDNAVVKELALVKVRVGAEQRAEVLQIGEHFGCKTVDLTETSLILQCTGNSEKIDALIGMLGKFRIIELVRTGKVLMARGDGLT